MRTRYAVTLLAASVVLVGALDAPAHDAIPTGAQPEGWTYPLVCCSGYDCRAVGAGTSSQVNIRETAEGYVISTTGETIAMTDRKIKPSPDGLFHWCSDGGRDDGKTICLFVPPRAF